MLKMIWEVCSKNVKKKLITKLLTAGLNNQGIAIFVTEMS